MQCLSRAAAVRRALGLCDASPTPLAAAERAMVASPRKAQFAAPILLRLEVGLAFARDVGVTRGGAAQADVRVLGSHCDRLIRRSLSRCRLARPPLAFNNMVARLLRELGVVGALALVS